MKETMLQKVMWTAFAGTFAKALESELAVENAKEVMKAAQKHYKTILAQVDEFENGSRFVFNILSGAMFTAVLLSLSQQSKKPTVEQARAFYRKAMMDNFFMRYSLSHSKVYTEKGRQKLKETAKKSQSTTNLYDWKFTVKDGPTINQYTATFTTCGILHLMTKWNCTEYVPAMCAFDYDMAAMNHTEFTRKYTLASGGPCCDCHYNHKIFIVDIQDR